MSAIVSPRPDAPSAVQQGLARKTGLLFLLLAVCGMFAIITLRALVVPGDAVSTAANILGSRLLFSGSLLSWILLVAADVAVSITLYLLLEPVSRSLSLIAAAFRLVYAAVLGALLLNLFDAFRLLTRSGPGADLDLPVRQSAALSSLDSFSAGFLLALVFFGVHLLALGVLLYRSGYVPRVFGVLLVAAGAGYAADSLATFFVPDHGGLASAVLVAPTIIGELGLMTWLLAKGVTIRPVAAVGPSFSTVPSPADSAAR